MDKFAPPRNRHAAPIEFPKYHLTGRRPDWQAYNLAEYYLWSALKFRGIGIIGQLECEQNKAAARFYLATARRLARR